MLSKVKGILSESVQSLIYLFSPEVCFLCAEALPTGVQVLCPRCMLLLPYTHYIKQPGNKAEQAFWGRIHIEAAFALLYFDKGGDVQKLIHLLKYKNHPEIGEFLGKLMGQAINKSAWGAQIDFIIPLPLHANKQKKRGYNQSEEIAKGIKLLIEKDVKTDILLRGNFTQTQTRKTRTQRWDNVKEAFTLNEHTVLAGKNILLVDDVLTTGATLEAAAAHLRNAGANVYIGVLAMAL